MPTAASRGRRLAAVGAFAACVVLAAALPGRPAQASNACLPSDLMLSQPPPAGIQVGPRAPVAGKVTKAPLTASSFQLVLSFVDVLPERVLLNTDDRSQLPIEILPATPPAGVNVNQAAGTISLFLGGPGPWYSQVCYTGNGMPITEYLVLTPPFSIASGTPRTVPIQRALAVNTLGFNPVDYQGRPITPAPTDLRSLYEFSFIHRKTGNFTFGFDGGFGAKVLKVSSVTPDYSFGAIGAVGRKFGLPLHLYAYSLRQGINGIVVFTNTASQLTHRQLVGYPGMAVSPVFFLTWIGFVDYAPGAPGFQAGLMNDFATATAPAGQAADLYDFQSSDTSLDPSAAGNAAMPDFPAFTLFLATMDTVPGTGALPYTLFTSPTFAGGADPTRAFLSVDTVHGVFDRPPLPSPSATVSIGAGPLFDTSFIARNCADGSFQLRARHLGPDAYVPYLTADFSNQANRQSFVAGATAAFSVRSGPSLITKVSISPGGPDLTGVLATVKLAGGNYRATLTNPGPQIAGTPFPVRTKSFFAVGPAVDGSPPGLTKVQLLVGGQLANAVNPTAQNVLLLGIDPVAGVNASCGQLADSLQTAALKVSRDGGPFAAVTLTTLANGDRQAVLPAAGSANRFDFKVSATDLAGNRLVSRFSLGVAGRGPGPAAALDTAFVVSPTSLTFSLASGGTGKQVLSLASADEPIGFTVSANVPWLSFDQISGVTPQSVTVSAKSTGLAVGNHQGVVTIAPEDPAVAGPVSIPVQLTVSATATGTQ
ncbi:MAG TPA: hypothetical protein VE075_09725 [Thermoanaerobaculia bacterium]|nr:hypothetical protein [Thermoanaerobaculia bacterium]